MTNIHTKLGVVRDAHAVATELSERVTQSQIALRAAQEAHLALLKEFRAATNTLHRAKADVQAEWSSMGLELEDDAETPEPEVRKWVDDRLYDSAGRWVAWVHPTGDNHYRAKVGDHVLGDYLSRSAAVAAVEKTFAPRPEYTLRFGVMR